MDFRSGDLVQVMPPSVKWAQPPNVPDNGGVSKEVCLQWEGLSRCGSEQVHMTHHCRRACAGRYQAKVDREGQP